MAKISARGDKAKQTWDLPGGGKIVLTQQGRILRKHTSGGTYNLLGKTKDLKMVERYAEVMKATYSL